MAHIPRAAMLVLRLVAPRRWSSSLRCASSRAARTEESDIVTISTFADVNTCVKRFLVHVHPDLLQAHGAEYAAVNATCVQTLLDVYARMRVQVQACSKAGGADGDAAASTAPLRDVLLSFYVAPATVGPSAQQCSVKLSFGGSFEERMRLLARRGLHASAVAQWLHTASRHTQALLDAVAHARGTPAVTLQLAATHAGIIDQIKANEVGSGNAGREEKRQGTTPSAASLAAAMRENLLQHSPLVQGKGEAFPEVDLRAESVYSPKQRHARVMRLLSRERSSCALTGVTPAQYRVAMNRVIDTFVRYHDALQLYHDVWSSVTLNIGSTYYADSYTRSLCIPHDFNAAEAVHFIRKHIPGIITAALQRTRLQMRRNASDS